MLGYHEAEKTNYIRIITTILKIINFLSLCSTLVLNYKIEQIKLYYMPKNSHLIYKLMLSSFFVESSKLLGIKVINISLISVRKIPYSI